MVEKQQEGVQEARATMAAAREAVREVNGNQHAGVAASAANAARVETGREGVEAHVLEMLQATCSFNGKWNVGAAHTAHKQKGGGMSLVSHGETLEGQTVRSRDPLGLTD
jgi:hypothetical protein